MAEEEQQKKEEKPKPKKAAAKKPMFKKKQKSTLDSINQVAEKAKAIEKEDVEDHSNIQQ